jgi:hypothetical protein
MSIHKITSLAKFSHRQVRTQHLRDVARGSISPGDSQIATPTSRYDWSKGSGQPHWERISAQALAACACGRMYPKRICGILPAENCHVRVDDTSSNALLYDVLKSTVSDRGISFHNSLQAECSRFSHSCCWCKSSVCVYTLGVGGSAQARIALAPPR